MTRKANETYRTTDLGIATHVSPTAGGDNLVRSDSAAAAQSIDSLLNIFDFGGGTEDTLTAGGGNLVGGGILTGPQSAHDPSSLGDLSVSGGAQSRPDPKWADQLTSSLAGPDLLPAM